MVATLLALMLAACGGPPATGTDLTLTLDGSGTVVVKGGVVETTCDTDCTVAVAAGTQLELIATGTGGATFAGWSGNCTNAGSCTITMNGEKNVTAHFRDNVLTVQLKGDATEAIQVSPPDNGTGANRCELAPGGACAFFYSVVIPKASVLVKPRAGNVAKGFEGCDKTNTTQCIVKVNGGVTVTLTVVHPPVALADSYTVLENKTLILAAPGVLTNDEDTEGDTLTAELDKTRNVAHGTLNFPGDGSFTYTPTANYSGEDSFWYRAVDAYGNRSSYIKVTITVNHVIHVNHAPTVEARTLSTNENSSAQITLTGSDPDGDPLTFQVVRQPTHGTLDPDTGNAASRTYTPKTNYNGTDTFTYKANDGKTDSNNATVTITVNEIVVAPSLTPTSSNCGGIATNETCVVHVALAGVTEAYRGAAFDFTSTSFTLASSSTGADVDSDCLIGNGPKHILLACGADDSFDAGELARLTLRRTSSAPSDLTISNVALATTDATFPIRGGSLQVE